MRSHYRYSECEVPVIVVVSDHPTGNRKRRFSGTAIEPIPVRRRYRTRSDIWTSIFLLGIRYAVAKVKDVAWFPTEQRYWYAGLTKSSNRVRRILSTSIGIQDAADDDQMLSGKHCCPSFLRLVPYASPSKICRYGATFA